MIGTKLAHYEITSHIGSGGMGEVYQATDTKLGRSVAIKFLPEAFSDDSERVARFEREARVLASLNHPHIAAIYGLEYANGTHFLVLELVEGETLADQLRRGPIPLDESLKIAEQLAEAVQAAHEKGVIHRDLKPANIKITHDGVVKVLDFGLAKATGIESAEGEVLSNSPTRRTLASTPGMILGTAAYMSPEQARGRPVDRRTDIFAFGCVLYEMLTGKRAFEGEDISDTLAAVLRADPDWNALPRDLPVPVGILLQRCLLKDRAQRIADMSVAKFVLSEPVFMSRSDVSAAISAQRRSRSRTALWIAAAALITAAATGALVSALRPSTAAPPIGRFSIALPEGQTFSTISRSNIAISPDGTQLVYAANSRLYRRSFSDLEATVIAGSEAKDQIGDLAFSPDGRLVAFYAVAENTLKRIALNGGTVVTICTPCGSSGVSWSEEGIVFGGRVILRVSPDGGTPERLVTLKEDEAAYGPQILPGGQAVVFTLVQLPDRDWEKAKIVIQSLATGERKTIIEGAAASRYLPTGHLMY